MREQNIARRREVLTGATEFPNLHEADVAVLDAKPVELAPYGEAKFKFDALPPMRLAAPFERLRDRSDRDSQRAAARGQKSFSPISARPPTSPRARHSRRAFSRPAASRLSTSGIDATRTFADPSASASRVRAFKASGAALACLCSSDKVYAGQAVAAAKALQAAGARHIYLAGRPGEQEAALRAAGVGDFIFAGGDALAALQEAYRLME